MVKIQVATDFSETAEIATQTALHLARKLGAELWFTHAAVMSEARPNAYEMAKGQVEDFRRLIQEDFAHRRAALAAASKRAEDSGIAAHHELLDGVTHERLCAFAEEQHMDLMILGSHGRTGVKRVLLGSVAERMVRRAHVDMLVARPPAVGPDGFRRILVCTDFSDCSKRALERALAMSAFDASIDVLHCWFVDGVIDGSLEPNPVYASTRHALEEDSENRGQELIASYTSDDRARRLAFHSVEGRPTSAVQNFLHEQEGEPYDLVAVGTHGRHGIERALLGSVAEVTVRYSPCSVLVAR